MTNRFPVYRVEQSAQGSNNNERDSEGRFFKFWCEHPELGRVLFRVISGRQLLSLVDPDFDGIPASSGDPYRKQA